MTIMSQFSLKNKVAVITGGYGYLGTSMSEGLSEAAATVVICGRSRAKFNSAFSGKKNIFYVDFDISSTKSIKNGFRKIEKHFGRVDILVNNAFYSKGTFPERMKDREWEYGIEGTVGNVFRCIRECIPYMRQCGGGSIINIASIYGIVSPDFGIYKDHPQYFNPPNYGVAKAGVIQLTKYYAVYLAQSNIRVNCVSPGAFPSLQVQKNRRFINKLSHRTPMHRIGSPDELKGVIVFLASDASSYIIGQNIVVDGGLTLW